MADTQAIIAPVATASAGTLLVGAGTAIAANSARAGWQIQNVGTNPVYVLFGTGASSSNYHAVLKGGTVADDGLGASISQTIGVVYTGIITIAGTLPRCAVLELTK